MGKFWRQVMQMGRFTYGQQVNLQPLLRIKAHSSWVRSVAFSPDGNVLASGSDDQLVKLWNTSKIETLKTIKS